MVHEFCSKLDFVGLHRLCTSFNICKTNYPDIQHHIHQELKNYHHLLFPYIEPTEMNSYPGQSSIFLGSFNAMNIPIVLDSGASKSLSPCKEDFVTFTETSISISGIGSNADVKGTGLVRWKIYDQKNQIHIIETEAFYVPAAGIRLYSPQSHFKEHNSGNVHLDHHGVKLQPPHTNIILSFPHNHCNNLPMMLVTNDGQKMKSMYVEEDLSQEFYNIGSSIDKTPTEVLLPDDLAPTGIMDALTEEFDSCMVCQDISDSTNLNLNPQQLELKGWHDKLNHVNFAWIQSLMSSTKELDHMDTDSTLDKPCIIPTKYKGTSSVQHPKCTACILGKMENVPKSTTQTHGSQDRHSLKQGDLDRGSTISSDQYVVTVKGRTLTNSSNASLKYNGGTIFSDHSSGRLFNHHQVSLRCGKTLLGKRLLEREAHTLGFKIKSFVSDNGIYKSKEFRDDLQRKNQTIRFSGVGAHHQNGIAERAIKTISYLTRASMIHSALRWPDQHDMELWPFAFDHSIYVHNNLPTVRDGLTFS
jgi:hypothetical protein